MNRADLYMLRLKLLSTSLSVCGAIEDLRKLRKELNETMSEIDAIMAIENEEEQNNG